MHHTKTVGDLAELKVAARFAEKGYFVSRPLSEHAPYDLIVDKDNRLQKVQVKARSIYKNGSVVVRKNTSNGPYSDGDFDLLALYCIDDERIVLLTWEELRSTEGHEISLRVEKAKNNQTKHVRYFEDYLFN